MNPGPDGQLKEYARMASSHDSDFLSATPSQIPQRPSKDSHELRAHRLAGYELVSGHSRFNDDYTANKHSLYLDLPATKSSWDFDYF